MKLLVKRIVLLGAMTLAAFSETSFGQVTMTDIGTADPTPGPNDIAQLSIAGDTKFPDTLNYYTDNGANNNFFAGQTFTTGNNPGGYQLVSLSIKMGGIDDGGGYNSSQLFHLYIYSISGGNSTVIKSYTATSSFTDGHWLRWTNLAVQMTPNTTYAYGFGRDSSGSGWAGLGNASGDLYPGGELAMLRGPGLPNYPVTFGSSHAWDGAFIAGLVPSTANQPPQIISDPSSITVYTNAPVTLTVGVDLNAAVPNYQWWKGTSRLNGETNASLNIASAQHTDAADYSVVVTNNFGAVTSSIATLTVIDGEPSVLSVQLLPGAPWSTPNLPLAPDDTIGAFPSANWNSGIVFFPGGGLSSTNTLSALKDQSGYGSSVQLTVVGVSDGWRYNDPAPDAAPITKLLNTFVKTTNPGGANTLGNGLMQLVFSNLDNNKTYDIYVYVGGGSDVHPNVDAGNGTTVYSGPEFAGVDQTSALVGCYNTDPNGTRNQANFVQLKNVTPTSGVITVSVQYDPALDTSAGGDLGVSGLQIVESSLDAVAPTIQTQPASALVYTNVPVTFNVAALGVPTPNIQWYEIAGGVTNLIPGATAGSYSVITDASLNGHRYFAKVSNPSGATNSAVATLNVVVGAPTGIWSVKTDPERGAYQALASTDQIGAYSTTNWNAARVPVGGGDQAFTLNDSKGVGTSVQLIIRGVTDGWYLNNPAPDSAPITKLLNTFVKYGYGPNWPNYPNVLGNGLMQLVFTNLNDSQTYDVYVYLVSDWVEQDYSAIDGGNGVTIYTGPVWSNVNQSSNLVASSSQDPANPDRGNYVHLTGLASSGGVITVTVQYHHPQGQGYGVGVGGVQLLNSAVDLTAVTIQQQPVSQRVLTNTPATFAVNAAGSPLFYQWYSVIGGVTNLIAGATNHNYTTGLVTDGMTGNGYFVVVSNSVSGGIRSDEAILTAGHLISSIPGFLKNDEYFNLPDAVTAVTSELYPGSSWLNSNPANKVEYLPAFDDNQDLPGNSGNRIYGWFTPSVSGDYVFFLASDDEAALWLSTDSNPAHAYQIAQNQGWMDHADWTVTDTGSGEYSYYSYGEWRSDMFENGGGPNAFANFILGWTPYPNFNATDGGIPLVAGTKYYIELDHFQGGGGQNAAVTYKLAGSADPATGAASLLRGTNVSMISAMDGSAVEITNQPASATVQSGATAAFNVGVRPYVAGAPTAPAPPVQYQWYLVTGGTTNAIAGATSATYTTAPVISVDSGKQFFAAVTTIGFQTNSALATLTVGAPQPHIVNISFSGGKLIISGTNGSSGRNYYVLTSTNVALPLNQWTPILTNSFDGSGAFSATNSVSAGSPRQFYLLQVP